MGKIIIDTSSEGVSLVKRYTDISIVKEEEFELSEGKNILEDLPYGFYFDVCSSNVSSIVFDGYDASRIVNMDSMFYDCDNINELNLSSFDTRNVTNMEWMFGVCLKLKKIDLSSFDTSHTTNMRCMFYKCENLKEIDLSSFDTRNVTDVEFMFYECINLEKIDLANFDMPNVHHMENMFYGCTSLRYIRCKKAFKEWCIANRNVIFLPFSMYGNGNGTWDIID